MSNNLRFTNTQCCGIKEISGIALVKPEEALLEVCQSEIDGGVRFGGALIKTLNTYSHYMFTAAVYNDRGDYGAALAKYITDQKLGTVTATPATINHAFHPDHKVQAYLWTPDQPALQLWWEKRGGAPQDLRAARVTLENYKQKLPNVEYYEGQYIQYKKAADKLRKNIADAQAAVNELEKKSKKVVESAKIPEPLVDPFAGLANQGINPDPEKLKPKVMGWAARRAARRAAVGEDPEPKPKGAAVFG